MKPIRVFYSPLSQRFYATNTYAVKGSIVVVTGKKFDVTNDIGAAIQKHDLEFTSKSPAKAKGGKP